MASIKYTNAKCGQCTHWKVTRNPLGVCRQDPEYQTTIGRFSKACGVFEEEIRIYSSHHVDKQASTHDKQ